MKKILITIILIATICLSVSVVYSTNTNTFDLESKSAILLDYNSGTIIYSKKECERKTIASMTKIMLLDLIFNEIEEGNLSLDEEIIVSSNASGMGGSQVFLANNGKYKAEDLIKSIIVSSANDASVAMAERLYGSEEECVVKMNLRAKELKMNDTVYTNCTGLPKPGQYSCAKDVAKIFCQLLRHKKYYDYSKIWMDEITHNDGSKTGLTNTNKLIRFYEGCDGGKTGYTSESGFCVATTAKRGNMRLVSVVIDAPTSKIRFAEVSKMFNYAFGAYVNKTIVSTEHPLNIKCSIENGKQKDIEIIAKENFYNFSSKGEKDNISVDFEPKSKIKAPIKKGEIIGKLIIFKNGIQIGEVDCLSNETVNKKTYFDYVKDVMTNWSIA